MINVIIQEAFETAMRYGYAPDVIFLPTSQGDFVVTPTGAWQLSADHEFYQEIDREAFVRSFLLSLWKA